MVLTGTVLTNSRRSLLGAMVGSAALASCGVFDREPEPAPQPDPLQPLLDESLALAAAYARTIAAQPDLAEAEHPAAQYLLSARSLVLLSQPEVGRGG